MFMRTLINNIHKRLAIYCIGWGVVQVIVAYILRTPTLAGYLICIFCIVITLLIWVIFPIIRRNSHIATIDIKFYILIRRIVFLAFVACFIWPALYSVISNDGIHMAFMIVLSMSSFCSILLASNLYGRSITEFLNK